MWRSVVAAVLLLALLVVIVLHYRHRQMVGDFSLGFPSAVTYFHDYSAEPGKVGNDKLFVVKGQGTEIRIDFDDIPAYKGTTTLGDVRAEVEDWRRMQTSMPFAGNVTEVRDQPFSSHGIQGYYLLSLLKREASRTRGRRVNEVRDIFFLHNGKPYHVNFWFAHSDSEIDKELVDKTWNSLLDQIGVSRSALPTAG